MVRVDHTFGPNDNIFGRWLQNSFDTSEGDFLNGTEFSTALPGV